MNKRTKKGWRGTKGKEVGSGNFPSVKPNQANTTTKTRRHFPFSDRAAKKIDYSTTPTRITTTLLLLLIPYFMVFSPALAFPPQLTPSTSAEEGSFVCFNFLCVLKEGGGGNVQSPTPQSPLLLSWSPVVRDYITNDSVLSSTSLLLHSPPPHPHHQLCISHRPWGK